MTARADPEDQYNHDLIDQTGDLAGDIAEVGSLETRMNVAGQLFFPAVLHLGFDGHRLERLDAIHRLDQEGLIFRTTVEFLVDAGAQDRRDEHRQQDVSRHRAQNDPGQQRAVVVHHRQKHEGEEQVDDQRQRRDGDETAHVFQLAHPRATESPTRRAPK